MTDYNTSLTIFCKCNNNIFDPDHILYVKNNFFDGSGSYHSNFNLT